MGSVFPIWSEAGVLTPKRQGVGSRLAIAGIATYACMLGILDVYPQMFGDSADDAAFSRPTEPAALLVPPAPSRIGPTTDGSAIPAIVLTPAGTRRTSAAPAPADVQAKVAPPSTAQEPVAVPAANETKATAKRRSRRAASNVQVFTTPDGREIYVHRPSANAFAPWDRIFDGNASGMGSAHGSSYRSLANQP